MYRSSGSFTRGKPRYKPQPQLLVLCEDTQSARTYLLEAALYFRASARVEVAHCGYTDPRSIVHNAIKRTKQFDEVICVVDRDEHARSNFEQASTQAASHPRVTLLVSYPCFEFWLLLHFGFTRAPYEAANKLVEALRGIPAMRDYQKGSASGLFKTLLPRLSDAQRHATKALLMAKADNEMNPSTQMHELIERLVRLGRPIPV